MKLQCPNCKHEGNVPDGKAPPVGVTVNCPKCKTKFQIPPQSPILKPEPNLYCPKCGTGQPASETCTNCGIVFAKYSDTQKDKAETNKNDQGLVGSPSTAKNTKPCPLCGEEILSIAKKCKHCNSMIEGSNKEGLKLPKLAILLSVSSKFSKKSAYLVAGCICLAILLIGGYIVFDKNKKAAKTRTNESETQRIQQQEPPFIGLNLYVVSPNGSKLVMISSSLSAFVSNLKSNVVSKKWSRDGNAWWLVIINRDSYTGLEKVTKMLFLRGLPDTQEHKDDVILGAMIIDGKTVDYNEVFYYVGVECHHIVDVFLCQDIVDTQLG